MNLPKIEVSVPIPAANAPAHRADPARGYLMVLVSTVVLSTTGIFIKLLLTEYSMEALAVSFWRVFLVAAALVVGLSFKSKLWRIHARDLPFFAVYGLLGVGAHQFVWVSSVQLNGAAVATVLVYIQAAIVAVISWRFLGEKFDRTRLLALGLSLSGVVLVSGTQAAGANLNAWGLLAGVGAGFTWSAFALCGRYATRRYSPWTSLTYAFLFGTLTLIPTLALVKNPLSLGPRLDGWAVLLFLALGPTLGGFGLYTLGLVHLPASVTVLIGTLEPVFTIVMAFFLFGETLSLPQFAGAALILWSVWLLRPRERT